MRNTMMNSRSRRNRQRGGAVQIILGIVGGVILLCVVVVVATVWAVKTFVHIEVSESGNGKRIEITTPFGELRVADAEEIAEELDLPVYPGARSGENGVSIRLGGRWLEKEGGLDVLAAEFRTRDSVDEVDAWYRERLSVKFERKEGEHIVLFDRNKDWPGEMDAEIDGIAYVDETSSRVRAVTITKKGFRTEIGMFEIRKAERQ